MSPDHYVLRPVPVEQRERWDQFVVQHLAGHLLQSWGWGELKVNTGWDPLRFALWDTEQERMVATVSALRYSALREPSRAGHFAYIPKGPVLDWLQLVQCNALFAQMNTLLRAQDVLTLRMELAQVAGMASSERIAEQVAALGFRPARAIQPIRTILLDLTYDEETLLARMKEKCRYNVRLAGRRGVIVRAAQSPEDVRAWYQLLQTTSEREQFGIHTLDYYLQAWRIFVPRNQARLLLAEYSGQLLEWEAMRWAKQQGATQYDLWGLPATDNDDEAMAGVNRFKRSWGGEVVSFMGAYECELTPDN